MLQVYWVIDASVNLTLLNKALLKISKYIVLFT